MKRKTIELLFILCTIPMFICAQTTTNQAVNVAVLCSKQTLKEVKMNGNFIPAIELTKQKYLLLASEQQFYILGWGGIKPIGDKLNGKIKSFAFTTDSLLLFILDNQLCSFDESGKAKSLYAIPSQFNKLSKGKYGIYLYDNDKRQTKHSILFITKGRIFKKLLTLPDPIESVVENKNFLYIASQNSVFKFDLNTQKLTALASLPPNKLISSLTVNNDNNQLFFSTDSLTFVVKNDTITMISNKMGGYIKYFDNGLLFSSKQEPFISRLMGISEIISHAKPVELKATSALLTNQSIKELVAQKESDNAIIKKIEAASAVQFTTDVDSMVDLSNHGVSSAVIVAMKKAMKNKRAK
jgi:hypothetical protein